MTTLLQLNGHFADWLLFAVWQSCLFLGGAVCLLPIYRRTPWKAHFVLVLGILLAVLGPVTALLIRQTVGGVFSPNSIFAMEKLTEGLARTLAPTIPFGGVLFVVFLLYGIVVARRLIFRARPVPDRDSQEALLESARSLRHVSLPILFTSGEVKTPTVWSWGLHPAVLFPETLGPSLTPEERDGIFLHELGHMIRRDHWTAFAVRLCGVFLFWNPLYWAALRQCDLAADMACDRLVLDLEKVPPQVYAETLLRLAAGEKRDPIHSIPILQFLSRKEQLMKRIDTVLSFTKGTAKSATKTLAVPKSLWVGTVLVTALLLTTALAFCQETRPKKEAAAKPERAKPSRETVFARMEPLGPEIDPKKAPKIVKTFPPNNATNVDPNISQVWLTFDMPMGGGIAWAQRDDKTALDYDEENRVFWTEDGLTCVAPVVLKRNKKYETLLNFKPFIGFVSVSGVPAEQLFYTFETGMNSIDPKKREELAKKNFTKSKNAKRPWGPEQATGRPDAYRYNKGADYPTAWASQTEDGQKEWLELTWDEPVEALGIRVYESYNPGALTRVTSIDESGAKTVLWEGKDPTSENAPKGKGISSILFKDDIRTKKIRLDFDSPGVPGWNEVDAVGLVDTAGKHHWATGATASSTYADRQR